MIEYDMIIDNLRSEHDLQVMNINDYYNLLNDNYIVEPTTNINNINIKLLEYANILINVNDNDYDKIIALLFYGITSILIDDMQYIKICHDIPYYIILHKTLNGYDDIIYKYSIIRY